MTANVVEEVWETELTGRAATTTLSTFVVFGSRTTLSSRFTSWAKSWWPWSQRVPVREVRAPLLRLAAPVMHDHHLLPRQFNGFFAKRGIDIDAHTVSLGEKSHLVGLHGKGLGNMPGGWNPEWAGWIAKNPNASAKEIFQQLGAMMDRYRINDLPIHAYGK